MRTLKQLLADKNRALLVDKPGLVYAIENEYLPGLVKIGMSTDSLKKRLQNINSTYPNEFTVIAYAQVRHARVVESVLHEHFASCRVNKAREFFRLAGDEVKAAIELCGQMMGASEVDVRTRVILANLAQDVGL